MPVVTPDPPDEGDEPQYTSAVWRQPGDPFEASMEVTAASDSSSAEWVKEALDPYRWSKEGLRVKSLVPEGYEAYARLFHEPWYQGPDVRARLAEIHEELSALLDLDSGNLPDMAVLQSPRVMALHKEEHELSGRDPTLCTWKDVAASYGKVAHPNMEWHQIATREVDDESLIGYGPELDMEELAVVVDSLRPFTMDGEACTFLVWEGYGHGELEASKAPRVKLAHEHLIFTGTIDSALRFVWDGDWEQAPNMWWPESRTWCVASEIDLDTTVIGGSREVVDAFLAHPKLECLPVNADDPIHAHADVINGSPNQGSASG
jgi:hypothetical protein